MAVNYLPFESAPSSKPRGVRWQRVALVFVFFWFLIGGVMHFAATDAEMRIVPPAVPDPRDVVLASGVFELLGAAGLMLKWTRRLAGWGLVALTICVTPAHFYMLSAHEQFAAIPMWLLWLRLPVQAILLWLIWWGSRRRPARTIY